MPVIANSVAIERSIHNGELLQPDDRSPHEKWHERQPSAVPLFESVLRFVAQTDDASDIHFEHAVNVRTGAARLNHALRNDLTHVGHRHCIAWNGYGRRSSRTRGWR